MQKWQNFFLNYDKSKDWILYLILVLIFITGCSQNFASSNVVRTISKENEKAINIYFCPRDDCSGKLSDFILSAEKSAHCAFFDLDLENVKNALNTQYKKGLDVKLAVDTDNYKYVKEFDFVVQDNRSSIMHNKFCIIDGKRISSGSMNPTVNGNEKNNNNLIIIESKYLAKNFEDEFQELWNHQFGKGDKVNNPIVYLNETRIENYFCPEDRCSEKIKDVLDKSEESIRFLVFSFTHDGIANSILMRKLENVSIKGIFEKRGTGSEYSKFNLFEYQGIDVRKDNNSAVMHHKVIIIDDKIVITGSFNPSKNADTRNDENILIIYDKSVAERYLEEFVYIWNKYSINLNNS